MRNRMMSLLFRLLSALCLIASAAALSYPYPDCQHGPMSKLPICDSTAPIDVRANSLLQQLNVSEKISRIYSGMNYQPSPAIPRLGLPPLQWINDAEHTLRAGENVNYVDGPHPFNSSTAFPAPINLAATFNTALVHAMADAIAIEARAFTNAGRGGVDLWSPNINTFRDPRWGRGQEVPGEDPLVASRYAYNFVLGMQGGEDPRYYKAVANCKVTYSQQHTLSSTHSLTYVFRTCRLHNRSTSTACIGPFHITDSLLTCLHSITMCYVCGVQHLAAYDVDQWNGTDRDAFDAQVGLKELVEYFLPPFEACIRDARAGSIMCSYNSVNGIPTCANDFLIQTVARELWQYDTLDDGWVVSDCNAIADIYFTHHYKPDMPESAAAALNAGCDLECGVLYRDHLPEAFDRGLFTEQRLDEAVLRLTKSLIRMGYFDAANTQPYRQYGPERVNSATAWSTAYQAAVQSLTLLKNQQHTLPLNPSSSKPINVVVIGPLATDTTAIQGNYYGKASFVISVLEGLQSYSGVTVQYVQGCDVASNRTDGFAAAVKAAQAADWTIYVGGLTQAQEDEGNDRSSLDWPGVQAELIAALSTASPTPLTLVVMGGGQIDMTVQRDSPSVGGILWVGYPSMFGGKAVADVVYGKVSPSGRLPSTSYPASYVSLPMTDMQLRPNATSGNPGRTYLWYTGQPVFPFGYGLSYTTFRVQLLESVDVRAGRQVVDIGGVLGGVEEWARLMGRVDRSAAPFLAWAANVTNTGSVVSDTSVLLFINSSAPDTPQQQLVDFQHVSQLQPGETRTVHFQLTMNSLAKVDDNGDRRLVPAVYTLSVGHAGHSEHSLQFELRGETGLVQAWPRQQSTAHKEADDASGSGVSAAAAPSCVAPSAGWQLDVVSLLGFTYNEFALALPGSCQLVTALNTCRDRRQACWNRVVGVDLSSGSLTFTVDLDAGTGNSSSPAVAASGLGRMVLSSSGQLVYWHRHLVHSDPNNTANTTQCNEVVALSLGPGASIRWRSSQCGSSDAALAVFCSLRAGNASEGEAADVLLQMQISDETNDEEWRSLDGSTGAVLHSGVAVRNSSEQWMDVTVNDEQSGVFTVRGTQEGRTAPNSTTYTLDASGVWTMRRQYSLAGPGAWSYWPSTGPALVQRPSAAGPSSRWRSIDRLTGRILWQNDTDTSLLNEAWKPAGMPGAVLSAWENPDRPELSILWGVANGAADTAGVTGYLDGVTGATLTTPLVGPLPYNNNATFPSSLHYWLDEHTVAAWLQWSWFVFDFPSMRLLDGGDVDIYGEYGPDAYSWGSLPIIAHYDSSAHCVTTVFPLDTHIAGRTFQARPAPQPPQPPASSSSSSTATASTGVSTGGAASESESPLLSTLVAVGGVVACTALLIGLCVLLEKCWKSKASAADDAQLDEPLTGAGPRRL